MKMEKIQDFYKNALLLGDERVENWPTMDTPVIMLLILIFYVLSLITINFIMKHRQQFQLTTFLYFYNFIQVVVSFYIFIEISAVAIESKYSLICEPVDYSTKPLPMRVSSSFI
jgi:hypothetical protein